MKENRGHRPEHLLAKILEQPGEPTDAQRTQELLKSHVSDNHGYLANGIRYYESAMDQYERTGYNKWDRKACDDIHHTIATLAVEIEDQALFSQAYECLEDPASKWEVCAAATEQGFLFDEAIEDGLAEAVIDAESRRDYATLARIDNAKLTMLLAEAPAQSSAPYELTAIVQEYVQFAQAALDSDTANNKEEMDDSLLSALDKLCAAGHYQYTEEIQQLLTSKSAQWAAERLLPWHRAANGDMGLLERARLRTQLGKTKHDLKTKAARDADIACGALAIINQRPSGKIPEIRTSQEANLLAKFAPQLLLDSCQKAQTSPYAAAHHVPAILRAHLQQGNLTQAREYYLHRVQADAGHTQNLHNIATQLELTLLMNQHDSEPENDEIQISAERIRQHTELISMATASADGLRRVALHDEGEGIVAQQLAHIQTLPLGSNRITETLRLAQLQEAHFNEDHATRALIDAELHRVVTFLGSAPGIPVADELVDYLRARKVIDGFFSEDEQMELGTLQRYNALLPNDSLLRKIILLRKN